MSLSEFTFKNNTLVKNGKYLNSKRDMRKKIVKSNFHTVLNDKIYKKDEGGVLDNLPDLASYDIVNVDPYSNIDNPFSILSSLNTDNDKEEEEDNNEETTLAAPATDTNPEVIDHDPFRLNFSKPTAKYLTDLFKANNIHAVITSAFRKNAHTKSGALSYHATGQAFDIVPENGYTFEQLKQELLANKAINNFLDKYHYGVLDETSPEARSKYGATGKNFHIGPDSGAITNWEQWKKEVTKAKNGLKFIPKAAEGLEIIQNPDLPLFFRTITEDNNNSYSPTIDYINNDTNSVNTLLNNLYTGTTPTIAEEAEEEETSPTPTSAVEEKAPLPEEIYNSVPKGIKNFYAVMKPVLERVLEERGLPKNNLLDMVAQLGEETYWGNIVRGTFNLGNIKAFNGKIYSSDAYQKGIRPTSTKYKNYSNLYDFANEYVNTLLNDRYNNPFVGRFANKLKEGGYASDSSYVAKINAAKKTLAKYAPYIQEVTSTKPATHAVPTCTPPVTWVPPALPKPVPPKQDTTVVKPAVAKVQVTPPVISRPPVTKKTVIREKPKINNSTKQLENSKVYSDIVSNLSDYLVKAINDRYGTKNHTYTKEEIQREAMDGKQGRIHNFLSIIAQHSPILENDQRYLDYVKNLNNKDVITINKQRAAQNRHKLTKKQIQQLATDRIAGKIHDAIGRQYMLDRQDNPVGLESILHLDNSNNFNKNL